MQTTTERPADFDAHSRLYRRALHAELNDWGRWIERHWDYEGYPSANVLHAFLMGRGGGNAGHRVLCLAMPGRVYSVHARILRLPEAMRDALWIWYVPQVKADGTVWTIGERCSVSGINEPLLRQRVKRAKDKLLGL